jgi:hypothetical protein
MNLRAWPWTRDALRRCCALQTELDEGAESWSRRPPNGLAARVLDSALEQYAAKLERSCERQRGGMRRDWKESVEAREERWRITASGEGPSTRDKPQHRSPPPQIEPAFDEG